MGLLAPPEYLAPPATEPLRFGLFSVATMPDTPAGTRWNMGTQWEPVAGERAELRASECVDAYTIDVVPRSGETTSEGIPFVVVGTYQCKAVGRTIAEAQQRARLHLAAGEERAVEYAIATGTVGNQPTFQGATDLTPTAGTPVTPKRAAGLIESALAREHGSVGAIHAPRLFGPMLDGIADRQGSHLETLLGTFVAAGGGYDLANVGPGGAAPAAGSAWLYGTGRPAIRRSEVFLFPDDDALVDKGTNDLTVFAQREYLVTWDGPTVAVLTDLGG